MLSIVISMSVRLSARISQKPHTRTLLNFCLLPVAVARSFSDGTVIRYVLPILWVASCFHSVDFIVRRVYS